LKYFGIYIRALILKLTRQAMYYNVTLRRVRANNVPVEKQ